MWIRKRKFDQRQKGADTKRGRNSRGNDNRGREKRHCKHCEENDGPYWTHNTADCRIKDKDNKSKERRDMEKSMAETMKKDMNSLSKSVIKSILKKLGKDSDSDDDSTR